LTSDGSLRAQPAANVAANSNGMMCFIMRFTRYSALSNFGSEILRLITLSHSAVKKQRRK
jgi:hypothetical protein